MNASLAARLIELNKDAKQRQAHIGSDWTIYNAASERSNVRLPSSADSSPLLSLVTGVQEDHERREVRGRDPGNARSLS